MRPLVVGFVICMGLAAVAAPAAAEPPNTHQVIYTKPSGFWTNPHPAKGGSYRWRLLAIGAALCGLTGIAMLRLVRKANAERAARIAR